MRILFTGGGTLGPVTPLLAVAEELTASKKSTPSQMYWIGTPSGPERELISQYKIDFSSIQSGKLRRYFSIKNFLDPFLFLAGTWKSFLIIKRFKPDIILGAGGYVQVPVIGAAWLAKKKSAVLQLDLVAGLANLMCASMTDRILLGFSQQIKDFPKGKVALTGIPVRKALRESTSYSDSQKKKMGLDPAIPTVFITGGGTGAHPLNQLIADAVPDLVKHYNVIHLTGKDKEIEVSNFGENKNRYQQFAFLSDDFARYLSVSDVVITRGGMGALTEICAAQKPMIVVPLPKSPQEVNAQYFESNGACIWRQQEGYTTANILEDIRTVLKSARKKEMLQHQQAVVPADAAVHVISELEAII